MSAIRSLQRVPVLGALAAALATFGALVGVAAGDSGVRARASAQAHTEVSNSIGSAVARCPAGKVVSGGFSAPGFSKETSPVVRVASGALSRREWKVDAVIFGDGGQDDQGDPNGGPGGPGPYTENPSRSGRIVSHAYCARAPGAIKTRQRAVEVASNGFASVTARCRRGQRAISGGFASPGLDLAAQRGVLALTSRKAGKRGWTVQGINPSEDSSTPGNPATLAAIVYCLKDGPRLVERSRQASVGPEQFRTIDVACPPGSKALSGGFDANLGPLGEDFSASGAVESFRMGGAKGWTTSAVSIDDGVGSTMTGFAYCAKLT